VLTLPLCFLIDKKFNFLNGFFSQVTLSKSLRMRTNKAGAKAERTVESASILQITSKSSNNTFVEHSNFRTFELSKFRSFDTFKTYFIFLSKLCFARKETKDFKEKWFFCFSVKTKSLLGDFLRRHHILFVIITTLLFFN